MKVCAIAAEYNPFHTGHAYQIRQARERTGCDVILAVMSGDFVQRGEPAVADKVRRAVCAIENGVDAVIALPYIYSTQSAGWFAHGAVSLMKLAGADYICFGSECGNLENLLDIADTPINPDHLQESLESGMSYPKAYSLLTTFMAPNDILAVSYLKEIAGTGIEPVPLSPRPRSASGIEPPTLREGKSNPRPLGYGPNALPLRYPAVLGRIPRPCRYLFIREFAEPAKRSLLVAPHYIFANS